MNSFTIPDELSTALATLAGRLGQPTAQLAAQAITDLIARETADLAEIEAGLTEADAGDFASPADLAAILETYRPA